MIIHLHVPCDQKTIIAQAFLSFFSLFEVVIILVRVGCIGMPLNPIALVDAIPWFGIS